MPILKAPSNLFWTAVIKYHINLLSFFCQDQITEGMDEEENISHGQSDSFKLK